MKNNASLVYSACLVVGDFLALVAAFVAAYILRVKLSVGISHEELGPVEADAGGTARKLVALGKAFGKDSPEYEQGWQALLRDCERRVGEAHRVNGWELFAETELDFDPETGDFFCDGFSLSEMLRNGLTPATNPGCPEEPSRRINEFVEVETDVALMSKDYMEGQSTYTFSQCPQSLIDRYQRNLGKRV